MIVQQFNLTFEHVLNTIKVTRLMPKFKNIKNQLFLNLGYVSDVQYYKCPSTIRFRAFAHIRYVNHYKVAKAVLPTLQWFYMEAWPSGKAGACKALIPSSNLGASYLIKLGSMHMKTSLFLEILPKPVLRGLANMPT